MAKYMYVSGRAGGEAVADPGTGFGPPCGSMATSSIEALAGMVARGNYTASELFCNIIANTFTSASSITMRINGVNGNGTISIPATTTGTFEDLTNTDSISDGDTFVYEVVLAGMHGQQWTQTSSMMTMENVIDNRCQTMANHITPSVRAGAVRRFLRLWGNGNTVVTINEAANTYDFQGDTGELTNLFINVFSNSIATASTWLTRIDVADGNLAISIPANTTGTFEDTTNTDTLDGASTDISVTFDVGTGMSTDTIEWDAIGATWNILGGRPWGAGDNETGSSITFGVSSFLCIENSSDVFLNGSTTESDAQVPARFPCIVRNLHLVMFGNTLNAATTLTFRVNAANSALSVSVPGFTTGTFEDTTDVIAVDTADDINMLMNSSASSSGAAGSSLWAVEMQQPDDMPWDFNQPPGIRRNVEVLAY